MNIPVSEAKSKFAELIRRVEAGEDIILTRNGKPVVQLSIPSQTNRPGARRKMAMGKYRGQIGMAEDFDDLGPEWDAYMR